VFLALLSLSISQPVTWQFQRGPTDPFPSTFTIPPENDPGWMTWPPFICAPSQVLTGFCQDPDAPYTINYHSTSRIGSCCHCSFSDSNYFQSSITVPTLPTTFTVTGFLVGADDAAEMFIFNSANPTGKIVAQFTSLPLHTTGIDLTPFLTTGDNRFVIVQVDECCCVSSLQAQVVICPQCNLQDQCHIAGTCNTSSGICSNPTAPNGQPCDDGNTCTQIDTCQSGSCVGSDPVVCVASDQCHTPGTCDAAGICSNPTAPNGQTCDDGNACTQIDTCQSGSCVGSDPVVCVASDQCHVVGTCDVATGICSNPNAPNGTSCNDGNSCTISDGCELGTCVGSNVCCYDTKSNRCGCCVKDCGNAILMYLESLA